MISDRNRGREHVFITEMINRLRLKLPVAVYADNESFEQTDLATDVQAHW